MKKLFSVLIVLLVMASLLATSVSAAPAARLTQTPELGQLKVCKVAGSGVQQGKMFAFRVNGITYNVPAGPADRGYCVLAGQYPVDTHVTIQEVIPSGYYVSRIEVKPDRTVSKNTAQGTVTVRIISGVVEAIFTNKVAGTQTPTRTPTSVNTPTPRPTKTATSTPSCAPNCTPTSTPIPTGRMQICKEADGPGVTGTFTFRFETNRSRQAPVGACAGLTTVNAGTLTVTEVPQTGYEVSEIYTIPADRLISKDLNNGSARIRIVEGTAASQTIVIFRNRATTITATSTFTSTPTATATGSITPTTTTPTLTATATSTPTLTPTSPVCPPARVTADFNKVGIGESVEGMGTVAPYLDIQATSPDNPDALAVRVAQRQGDLVYVSPNTGGSRNGGMVADGGFTDLSTRNLQLPHQYSFVFDPNVTISNFTLHMLDYGDLNRLATRDHLVTLTGVDANGSPIPGAYQELRFTTDEVTNPAAMNLSGDAVGAVLGEPGNWTWNISGAGIHEVVLAFPEGYDPNIAFDLLSFTVAELCICQSSPGADFFADFTKVGINQSVEGPGTVAPYLDIQATSPGNPDALAVRVAQRQGDVVYVSPNTGGSRNGAMVADGGFTDLSTRNQSLPHEYIFSFDQGVTVSNFTLHMLDYGDLNWPESINHLVTLTGLDANGDPIPGAYQELRFTTDAVANPAAMNLSGDAVGAVLGEPGNYTWNISGTGISSLVLAFPEGHDPNIAFNRLYYSVECASLP